MHADEATVIQSLASGLDGYLLKDADPEDVLAAVHSAAGGSLVVGAASAAVVVAAAASAPRTDALAALDARDLEILELLVDGLPTSQVAARALPRPQDDPQPDLGRCSASWAWPPATRPSRSAAPPASVSDGSGRDSLPGGRDTGTSASGRSPADAGTDAG